jgi:23S rRNA pseudouridine1911/1915/1917 synthase
VSDLATRQLTVTEGDTGKRLDRLLAERVPEVSRTRLQALIDGTQVRLNGQPARPSTKVAAGDEIVLEVPPPQPLGAAPEPIPLNVLYEDDDLLVVNKPAGMVVHPAPGHAGGTLVNALLAHVPALSRPGGPGEAANDQAMERPNVMSELRPGIVHRLDKDTSGLILVAKHDRAHRLLAAQLKERQMDKRYLALVDGAPPAESGTVEGPIGRDPRRPQQMGVVAGGREAVTHFRMLRRYARHTLLECKPVTGRTHQIRVHLAAIHCPVAGDTTYGRKPPTLALARHFLHAARLTFRLPSGDTRTFEAPLPPDLQEVLTQLDHTQLDHEAERYRPAQKSTRLKG